MVKKITLLAVFVLFMSPAFAFECEGSYQNASYGFLHTETAMEANNVTQLKQYAVRAQTAIKKVLAATEKCGCTDANYASYDALENLALALEKEAFEEIRFRVSRAKSFAKATLVALDECNAKRSFTDFDNEEEDLIEQEQQLLAQQQQLLAQQQALAAKIEKQKALQNQVQKEREAMLIAQKELQRTAEAKLDELAQLISSFTSAMDCYEAAPLTSESYKRKTAELALETLDRTKAFYAEKASEMANTLVNRLNACEIKE